MVVVERATQGVFVVALALALRCRAVPSPQQAALTRASCVRLSRLVLLVLPVSSRVRVLGVSGGR